MAEFVYEREEVSVIVIRIPKRLWLTYESRHKHYGDAIHNVRETVIETIGNRLLRTAISDQGDPFWRSGG